MHWELSGRMAYPSLTECGKKRGQTVKNAKSEYNHESHEGHEDLFFLRAPRGLRGVKRIPI